MTINELCKEAHTRAVAAGWWEPGKEKRPLECHMLICSEIAEATEEVRNNRPAFYFHTTEKIGILNAGEMDPEHALRHAMGGHKPEGEAVEMADAIIRIADWAGRQGWDLEAVIKAKMAYNATRGYRHGGKAA